ncbi:MAG: TolC family protein [Paramuribaculum sp.]|nr:TolC family protein [Paramuribaculum sp.]
MKSHIIALSIALTAIISGRSQEWTYTDCVDYAREHNITLQKSILAEQTAEADLDAAKGQWQPTLDFATTHGYTNTPWSGGNRNAYASSYGLNGSWTVWDGGVRSDNIKIRQISLEQSRLATRDYIRTLETDLLQIYLNLLYAKETIEINTSAAALSEATAKRAHALMEAGKMSRVDYAQLQSQYEQDRYNLVNARATYDARRMELKQLLELGLESDITPAAVVWTTQQVLDPLPPMEESYDLACGLDLQLESLRLSQEAAALDAKVARAGHSPKISLSAGVGTGYYAPGSAFGSSLKQSWNEQIGLTLSIPILDQRKTRSAVAKARVQQLNSSLDADKRLITLSQLIENWYIDTRSAQARYEAALQQLESAQLTDELTNERFRIGYINPLELLSSHSALTEARHTLLQAKYMTILGKKMIEYYRTANVTLN